MENWDNVRVFGERPAGKSCVVRASAYAVIESNGTVAVVRTDAGFFLPGGGIDGTETPEQAAIREALEECGLVIRPANWRERAIQIVYSRSENRVFEKRSTFVDVCFFECRSRGFEDSHELEWLDFETACRLLSHESHAWATALWRNNRT